jgi:hypothetical protein
MNFFKFLLICTFIYQTLAGGPTNLCVPCSEVFANLVPLSSGLCDHGSFDPITVSITFKPEAGLADAQGVCIDIGAVNDVNPLIDSFSAVA